MSASISQLIPELQPFATDLLRAAGAAGLLPRITSTRRSTAEQTRLYRRYQQGLQQYPVAPPGTSAHEFGYAFDMVISPLDYLPDVGSYWKEQGGVWGGEFNDPIHFEYPGFKDFLASQSGATDSTLYKVATTVAGLAVPLPVTAAVTLSGWIQAHPEVQWVVDLLPSSAWLELPVDSLPKWLKDVLTF